MDFSRPNEIKNILTRCDAELGGYSTAHLDVEPVDSPAQISGSVDATAASIGGTESSAKSVAHFHGVLNLDLPANRPDVVQSGYAMFRTRDQRAKGFAEALPVLFGDQPHWNWETCTHILLRVKGDRRKYFVNVQAESPLPADIYQHRLFLKTPGQWEDVLVPLDDFILTNWGVIQEQRRLNKEYVKTIGIGLIDKQYGPFSLYIDKIQAINTKYVSPDQELSEAGRKITPAEKLPGKQLPMD